jgi:hypothetical protein
MVSNSDQEHKWASELKSYRILLKMEMLRVLNCSSNDEKRLLAKEWKEKYSQIFYKELVNMAKDRNVRAKVANWDIDNFDKDKLDAK